MSERGDRLRAIADLMQRCRMNRDDAETVLDITEHAIVEATDAMARVITTLEPQHRPIALAMALQAMHEETDRDVILAIIANRKEQL